MNLHAAVPSRPYVIVTGDFVRTGGMDRANLALASFLARAGRKVHLVAYRVADELRASPNVVFHPVWKPANSYALAAPLLGARGILCGRAVAPQQGVVVVNGGNCPFPAMNWVHYVHAAFRPMVASAGWRLVKAHAMHEARLVTERIALRSAKVVVANSERTRRDVIQLLGVAERRVQTIYYGIDADRFRPATPDERASARQSLGWAVDRPRIAFVGALDDRRKGFDVVYNAWRSLCSSASWDGELVVIGKGGELTGWRTRALRDGLGQRIQFLGFRPDVSRVLMACDALVAPTRYEAYGLGVHEALCCGLPAIVASTAGVAERYPDSLRGLLLEDAESADELAAALHRWREHAAEWQAKVLAFSEELRARSWDDAARDMVALGDTVA